ncbi:TetR family transcriptional regulator [Streptomyces sp. SID5785]|uniref:TetR/AcrR family transcriptional regulator n=1 Tax=Streptomyces sp. SID5785 TaxID=2690309 RepID=UPI001360CAE6|nr:helix-turn-helix domain-containing protein [Streptomyces sp. SID5785]MZD09683.1 TetR family transcriptional regulator [Streptomyces sp. SID5785]
MPAARESLLDAACAALGRRAWSAVRMVDVAAAASVSRQTLYNEFGSKDGLARALVRRETDLYLAGADRALREGGLEALADWTTATARCNPVVRAALTGCWSERLPSPTLSAVSSPSTVPAQRRANGPLPSPADFVCAVRDRASAALGAPGLDRAQEQRLARDCELVVRLALSCVVAPPEEGGVGRLVRDAVGPRAG